jgi:hypothetical protein
VNQCHVAQYRHVRFKEHILFIPCKGIGRKVLNVFLDPFDMFAIKKADSVQVLKAYRRDRGRNPLLHLSAR